MLVTECIRHFPDTGKAAPNMIVKLKRNPQ